MAGGPTIAASGGRRRGGVSVPQAAWVLNLLTDLAFNLLIFFVVCASNDPGNKGWAQQMPSANKDKAADQQAQNVEVVLTRTTLAMNGAEVPLADLESKLRAALAGKTRPEEKVVVFKIPPNGKDTPYSRWIKVATAIERAGGTVAMELQEEKTTVVE